MAKGPQHKYYAAWLERRRGPREPKIEAELLVIADAYDAAIQSGKLSDSQLQRVVDGASSPRAMLWYNATDLLMKLSGRWPTAADAIAPMLWSDGILFQRLRLHFPPKRTTRPAAQLS